MAKTALTVNVRIDGVRQTLAAFRDLPKDANDALRDKSMELAQTLAGKVAADARSEGRQAAILAATVAARRDRVPVVVAGGTKRIGRNRKPAFKLLFGSVFGSNRLKQFKPHYGQASYWFFDTVEAEQDEIAAAWRKVADDLIAKFGEA